jgi:UDP-glucose:(heptosyl)LPS alpha-1,3-glucosyltransferase
MQIAICHQKVLPARGGAEMYVADLTRRLACAGHDVHLYATRWDRESLPGNVTVHALPSPRGPRWRRPWRFSETLRAALAAGRPQVSIGFDKTLGTDVYYPLGGLNVSTATHNLLKHRPGLPRLAARLGQLIDPALQSFVRLERRLFTGADRPMLVANSKLVRRHAHDAYGLEPATVPVIHNAIDPDRFAEDDRPRLRAEMRRQWEIGTTDVAAAIVAMNYRLKGLEPLLHALPLLPDSVPFKLIVAGSPAVRPYERLAERLGVRDRVRFVGHCRDVRRVFFAADMLVHPTFYDPCSLVVLEALACGLPVVTTRNNGAGELMRPPAEGFVIDDPHDLRSLAAAVTELLDPDRRAACSKAARQAAAAWTFDHHVRALEAVLADAAARRSKAAG